MKGRYKSPEPILHLFLLVMNESPFQGWVGAEVYIPRAVPWAGVGPRRWRYSFRPKGALHESLGQRPGYRDQQSPTALKGRHKPPEPILHLVLLVMNESPFQGWVGV